MFEELVGLHWFAIWFYAFDEILKMELECASNTILCPVAILLLIPFTDCILGRGRKKKQLNLTSTAFNASEHIFSWHRLWKQHCGSNRSKFRSFFLEARFFFCHANVISSLITVASNWSLEHWSLWWKLWKKFPQFSNELHKWFARLHSTGFCQWIWQSVANFGSQAWHSWEIYFHVQFILEPRSLDGVFRKEDYRC